MKARALLAWIVLTPVLFAHDPEEQKLLASDGMPGDAFGAASSVDDETILVGAPGNDEIASNAGAAYVFIHDDIAGGFVEEAKLLASDGALDDAFGSSVFIHGDLAIVGAPGNDEAGADAGAAYVFLRTGSSWTQEAKLLGTAANDAAGTSVSMTDTTAIVGAPQNANGATGNGAALVFVRTGTTWSLEDTLTASDGAAGHGFGQSVTVSGDLAAAGAPQAVSGAGATGRVYVYERSGTTWTEQASPLDGAAAGDRYGESVFLWNSSVLAVGAPGSDDNGAESGVAYTYNRAGSGWNQIRSFEGASAGDELGASVAYSYRTVLLGAAGDDDEGPDTGSAQIYANLPGGFGFEIFIASDAVSNDALGSSVGASDCWLVAGASGNDELGADAGAVYVYVVWEPSAVTVNGTGVNPLCMTTVVLPVIGEVWQLEVDGSVNPNTATTQLLVTRQIRTTPQTLPFGEAFVVRPTMILSNSVAGSGLNTHNILIPNDPFLTGLSIGVQGILRDNTNAIIQLCNAEMVSIGCHHEE